MSMRTYVLRFFLCLSSFAAAQSVSGPSQRVVTPPQTLVSQSNPDARPIPIADLFFSHRSLDPAWSPDGKQVAYTSNVNGRFNLWKMNSDGTSAVQLMQSEDGQDGAVWSPDGKWIVYIQDSGGNEIYDVYAVPSNGGEVINLTNTPDISESNPMFSPDGGRLAIDVKSKNSAVADVAVLDWHTHQIRKLTNEISHDHLWQVFAWSTDGKQIFANRVKESYTDSDVYSIDAATGVARNLTAHTGDLVQMGSSVSPDGKVLLSSNAKGGFQNVALLDSTSGKLDWVTDTQWEASAGHFSPDGRSFTYTVNEDGRTTLFWHDASRKTSEKLSFPEGLTTDTGTPNSFSPDGKQILVLHEDGQRPSDLWLYDVARQSARQLTHSALASLNPSAIPPSQLVHYKSFDGTMISAYVWMPFNLKRDGTNPVIVIPHGGPTGQTIDNFNSTPAAFASRGYICVSPNVRGSTGYGMVFQKANYKDLGGGDLQDEIYATKFLVDSGYGDSKKVGITGHSYGGYVTLLAVGKTPNVWAAAASEFGIVDWRSLMKHTDPRLQEYVKSLLGDPVADQKVYEQASPLTYLRNTKAPLLVLQGENDRRVPKEEAQQVVDTLTSVGKTVSVHFYPQEGHGYQKRENEIDALTRIVDWFDKYLKNAK